MKDLRITQVQNGFMVREVHEYDRGPLFVFETIDGLTNWIKEYLTTPEEPPSNPVKRSESS